MSTFHVPLRGAAAVLFGSLLTACGWRLQGTDPLPPSMGVIRLEATDVYTDFYRELHDRLQAAGATVRSGADSAAAPAVMEVHADQTGQRVLSVSARNTPEEYEVFYRVEYSMRVDGQEVIARQQLQLTASYSYDTRIVLAKRHEQEDMQQALARELAAIVMRRLSTVKPGAQESPQS